MSEESSQNQLINAIHAHSFSPWKAHQPFCLLETDSLKVPDAPGSDPTRPHVRPGLRTPPGTEAASEPRFCHKVPQSKTRLHSNKDQPTHRSSTRRPAFRASWHLEEQSKRARAGVGVRIGERRSRAGSSRLCPGPVGWETESYSAPHRCWCCGHATQRRFCLQRSVNLTPLKGPPPLLLRRARASFCSGDESAWRDFTVTPQEHPCSGHPSSESYSDQPLEWTTLFKTVSLWRNSDPSWPSGGTAGMSLFLCSWLFYWTLHHIIIPPYFMKLFYQSTCIILFIWIIYTNVCQWHNNLNMQIWSTQQGTSPLFCVFKENLPMGSELLTYFDGVCYCSVLYPKFNGWRFGSKNTSHHIVEKNTTALWSKGFTF